MQMVISPLGVTGAAIAVPAALGGAAIAMLRAIERSVGVMAPTAKQLNSEDLSKCALFRHLPDLREKIAWRQLSDSFPTPINSARLGSLTFSVKREDLASPLCNSCRASNLIAPPLTTNIANGTDWIPI